MENKEVQIFYQHENTVLIHDEEKISEWKKQIEELGLEGQKTLFNEDKNPIPYMYMKSSLLAMFNILCPAKMSLSKYDKEPIPQRVLELIPYCKEQNLFSEIEVWYDDTDPDPVLVGYDHHKDSWNRKKYLIARWGDEHKSFEELKVIAKKRRIEEKKAEMAKRIKEFQMKLEAIEHYVEEELSGKYINWS